MPFHQKGLSKTIKNLAVAALVLATFLGAVSCAGNAKVNDVVLTQKKTDSGRTQISVLVKYAFSINSFEAAVEEKFPDIDIVQVGNYTKDMGIDEYASRLKNDDLTDIVMTWPLDVGEEYWEDRLLDLSGMDFTSRYNLSMLNDISRDGKLYYLPGPSQVRGIVYNKTLFEENGWQIPSDYRGFLELCKTIEKSGMRSLQLGLKNGEVLDTAFIGYNYSNFYSKPQDIQWLSDYNNGTGSFARMGPAFGVFEEMIDAGIFKPSDLDVDYSAREKMLFTRQCAMLEDSVLMARMGYSQTGTTDEFALMPFFNPGNDGDWARLYMVCYIGLNKNLAEPQNKDKYELVKKLMDYISTPDGQEALAADTGAMFSSLMNTPPPDIPEIQALLPALNNGRYAAFPQLKNAESAFRESLAGLLRGDITREQAIAAIDEQNASPQKETAPEKLGEATSNFSLTETGNFVTDAMREWSGSDIALFLDNGKDGKYNGKGLSGSIYKGDITTKDIYRIMPDLKYGDAETVCKVTMTGENLIKALEYALPVNNNNTGWFYYFSGIKMEYDPTAEPGSRIKSIKMADGSEIVPDKVYTVTAMDETIAEEYRASHEGTDATMTKILEDAIKSAGSISPSNDGRFIIPK